MLGYTFLELLIFDKNQRLSFFIEGCFLIYKKSKREPTIDSLYVNKSIMKVYKKYL